MVQHLQWGFFFKNNLKHRNICMGVGVTTGDIYHIYRKDSRTRKIAAGKIWASNSGETPLAVAE